MGLDSAVNKAFLKNLILLSKKISQNRHPFKGYLLSSDNYQMGSNGFSLAISGGGILPVNYLNFMHYVCLKIKYNSKFYFGRPPATISSSFNNDKHSFKLNKTWFYSSSNPDEDSILVKGVFNEP